MKFSIFRKHKNKGIYQYSTMIDCKGIKIITPCFAQVMYTLQFNLYFNRYYISLSTGYTEESWSIVYNHLEKLRLKIIEANMKGNKYYLTLDDEEFPIHLKDEHSIQRVNLDIQYIK